MKCIFKHKWVYSEKRKAIFNINVFSHVYAKRTCYKCGIVQENNGFFDTSWDLNIWTNKWITIKAPDKHKVRDSR